MPILRLTQSFVSNDLRCPEDKSRIEFCDRELPGLYVEVRPKSDGSGTYYLRYKDANSKTCHQKIARTTEIDLTEARKRAKKLKAEIQLGANPRGEAKAQKEVPTLDAFFTEHYSPFAWPRKRSFGRDEELYRLRIAGLFGNRRLNQISRQQIQSFHTELLQSGLAPATCDHHLKLLKRVFNLAIDWGVHTGTNPVARVPMFNADNRIERYLDEAQLQRLVNVLRTDANRPVCNIALFLLSTGARLSEALSATWEQIDRDKRVWRIPAMNSKSKRIRAVPLNDSALEVLAQVETAEGYVFINKETSKPYTTIAKVWERLRKTANVPQLRLHDLRHSFASMLINSGRTIYEVQRILGHSDTKVTERYARQRDVRRRRQPRRQQRFQDFHDREGAVDDVDLLPDKRDVQRRGANALYGQCDRRGRPEPVADG
jgi:integrase